MSNLVTTARYIWQWLPRVSKTLPEKLLSHFRTLPRKVFTVEQFGQTIADFAKAIRYPFLVKPDEYVDYMVNQKMVDRIVIENRRGKTIRILTDKVSLYDIGLTLTHGAYISHHSAAYLQGLSITEPELTYISAESSRNESIKAEIDQAGIDKAFGQQQRKSTNIYQWNDQDFLVLTSLHTDKEGIATKGKYRLTEPERTLLDVTVRPAYGGGAKQVLKMYENGLKKDISIKKIINLYDFMEYNYPYHQAIGFYLESAGYNGRLINKLAERPMPFTFYLDYAIKQKEYSARWNLFYPKNLIYLPG